MSVLSVASKVQEWHIQASGKRKVKKKNSFLSSEHLLSFAVPKIICQYIAYVSMLLLTSFSLSLAGINTV